MFTKRQLDKPKLSYSVIRINNLHIYISMKLSIATSDNKRAKINGKSTLERYTVKSHIY